MRYSSVLLDLDHTLLDTDTSTAMAFDEVMGSIGFEDGSTHYATYDTINLGLWRQVEAGSLDPNVLHSLRFELLLSELGIDADPQAMADKYARGMGAFGELYSGARELLENLSEGRSLAMVTNGLSTIQRDRVERLELDQYFDAIVISGEVGTAKPGTQIFDITFSELDNPAKGSVVMVGDNLSSDIQGGANYGIDTVWFNPTSKANASGVLPTYELSDLGDLVNLV